MLTRLLTKGSPLTAALTLLLAPHALRAAPPSPNAPLVAADDRFAFRLFHALTAEAGRGRNVFVSPSSVALALEMTYSGTGGATRAAMARALGLQGLSLAQVNAGNAAQQDALRAAATAVVMMPAGALPPVRAPPITMRVDRPFLCVLRDSGTGAILFMGAITDPQ